MAKAVSVTVTGGADTRVEVRLGRLRVIAPQDTYVQVLLEKQAAGGSLVPGDQVDWGRTDQTRFWTSDLTSGLYAVVVGDRTQEGVVITDGQVTDVGS